MEKAMIKKVCEFADYQNPTLKALLDNYTVGGWFLFETGVLGRVLGNIYPTKEMRECLRLGKLWSRLHALDALIERANKIKTRCQMCGIEE